MANLWGRRMSALVSIACWLATGCADDLAVRPTAAGPEETDAEIQGASADASLSSYFESDEFVRPEVIAAAGGLDGNAGAGFAAVGGASLREADIMALDGDRLFALSEISGLSVLDVSDPQRLRLLGRFTHAPARPLQLYPRGDRLWVLYSAGRAVEPGMSNAGVSYLQALDVSDPAAIRSVASLSLPGVIDDSRLVGDVLYVVSNETPGCRSCTAPAPPSVVTSFDLRDAEHAQQLDQVRFGERPEDWTGQNRMLVTPQRLYVAGPQADVSGWIGSTIQVIDISGGSGALTAAARVQVAGVVNSPWQMDEQDGVLRVISQGRSPQPGPAILQSFAVRAAGTIEPLAQLSLPAAGDEGLQGARFAGSRGYAAVGGVLHVLDLAEPAAPKLDGTVQADGTLDYLEPRGDRLLALGSNNSNGQKVLSLFDVSRPGEPSRLSQVSYRAQSIAGLGPSPLSLTVLPDQGLIVVPAPAFDFGEQGKCNGRAAGGLQLVSYEPDRLTLLGRARSEGQPRRALLHRDHVLAAGDERVEAFSIADRNAPNLSSGVTVQQTVSFVARLDGGVIARIVQPLDNIDPRLELASEAQVDDPSQRLGVLSLRDQLTTDPKETCQLQFRVEAVHANGNRLHVVFEAFFSVDEMFRERRSGVLVIDASDPSAPRLAGKADWNTDDFYPYTVYAQHGYVEQPSYVWHGDSLLLIEVRVGDGPQDKRLRSVDMRDPAAPGVLTVELSSDMYLGLLVSGDTLFASRYHELSDTRIQHYVDRVDLSDPGAPRLLPAVNTPGALLQIEPETRLAIGYSWRFPAAQAGAEGCIDGLRSLAADSCRVLQQSLHLFSLDKDAARLHDRLTLPNGERLAATARAQDRVFAVLYGKAGSTPLLALPLQAGPLQAERAELSSAELELYGRARAYAHDGLVLISRGDAVVTARVADDGSLRVQDRRRVSDWVNDVILGQTRALLALGFGGSEWLDL